MGALLLAREVKVDPLDWTGCCLLATRMHACVICFLGPERLAWESSVARNPLPTSTLRHVGRRKSTQQKEPSRLTSVPMNTIHSPCLLLSLNCPPQNRGRGA
jgi:hypothetical protein